MEIHNSRIKNIIGRSFIFSSAIILVIGLVGSIYFNNSGLQILREANLKREQELLSNFLVPAIKIADMTEVRRLLSLASDANEKFVVIDNSENILMPNYDDLSLVKAVFLSKNILPECRIIRTGYQTVHGNKLWINCSTLVVNDEARRSVGILISISPYPSLWFSSLVFYFFGIAVISLLFNMFWFRRVLHKRLLNPLTTLGERIINVSRSPFNSSSHLEGINNLPFEIKEIKKAFQGVLMHLQDEYKQRTESEKKSALLDQAARVAHDIRSPIAAMEMSLHVFSQDISKEKILMMQMAVQSVRDIANNLLEKYRDNQPLPTPAITLYEYDNLNVVRPILLYSLIEQVVSQKRYEWLHKSCELTFNFKLIAKSAWIIVAPCDVKCMVSNLLNNALEACEKHSKIHLQLNKIDNFLYLFITDNGTGMTSEKIECFLGGKSSKHAGKGMGLCSAKKYMETIGGKLTITSELAKGTTVKLAFLVDKNPDWYPDTINLSKNDILIVLDDDVAMQSLWFHRLQCYANKIYLFTNYEETINWIKSNYNLIDKMIFLIDYELLESSVNGLTLLKCFDIKDRGYLVTSHAEEFNIQTEVKKMGVHLIPKTLASEIPIKFSQL